MREIHIQKVNALPGSLAQDVLYLLKEPEGSLNLVLADKTGQKPARAIRKVQITGPRELYQSSEGQSVQGQYLIKNFDVFTTYSVTVSAGSASLVGNIITINTPTVPGDIYLGVNGELSKIKVLPRSVIAPKMTSPLDGQEGVSTTFTATCTAFQVSSGSDTCAKTQWRISTDPEMVENIQNFEVAGDAVSFMVSGLSNLTDYIMQIRKVGTTLGASQWSKKIRFKTRAAELDMSESTKLKPLNPSANERFGISTSMDANAEVLAVGTMYGKGKVSGEGCVYIYRYVDFAWVLEKRLYADDGLVNDYYGMSVELSRDGKVLVVGASGHDSRGTESGAVYVYTYYEGDWILRSKLTASDGNTHDNFGCSVAVNTTGSTIVIGAVGHSSSQGAVYAYTRVNDTWVFQSKLVASDKANNDEFGASVAVNADGSLMVIGAPGCDGSVEWQGKVYLFKKTVNTWSQIQILEHTDPVSEDFLGESVTVSEGGMWIFAEANGYRKGLVNCGGVAIFRQDGETWRYWGMLTANDASASQNFGSSIKCSHDGSEVFVGALGDNSSKGAFYVFSHTDGVWSQKAKRTVSVRSNGEKVGASIAISRYGHVVAVGAFGNSEDVIEGGALYLYS